MIEMLQTCHGRFMSGAYLGILARLHSRFLQDYYPIPGTLGTIISDSPRKWSRPTHQFLCYFHRYSIINSVARNR